MLLLPDSRNAKPTENPTAQRDAGDEEHVFSSAHLDDTSTNRPRTNPKIRKVSITHGADRRLLPK